MVPSLINNIKPHLLQRTSFHVFDETQYANHFYLLLCLNRVVTGLLAFKKNGLQRDTVGRVLGGVQKGQRRAFKSQIYCIGGKLSTCSFNVFTSIATQGAKGSRGQTTPTVLQLCFVSAEITLQLGLSRPCLHKELQDCLSVGRTDTHTHIHTQAWRRGRF